MNKAASVFFHRVQITFDRKLILGIWRIAGPAKSAGKSNLTVHVLEPLLEAKLPGEGPNLSTLIDAVKRAASFTKDWRNRWLAHRDLDLSIGSPTVMSVSDATLGRINGALTAVDDVLKSVDRSCKGNSAGFRRIIGDCGSKSLIRVIDEGLRAREQRMARLQAGDATEDDVARLTSNE